MVQVLDPPAAETQAAPKKRGGGPRTLRGRMKSRENAVKSSLRSKVVFSKDMAIRILERNRILDAQMRPKSRYELMLIADMALAKARMDRAAELQIENADRYIDRTIDYWDHDQEARALKLKARLARNPDRVAHELSGFKQGADLMIATWQGLASALEITGDWNEEQRQLSLDLRGVPHVLRVGNWLFPPSVDKATLAATAAREIARLQAKKDDWLDEHDGYNQDDTLSGIQPEDDPTTKRLRRCEASARRDYDKAFAELMRSRAEGEARFKETGIRDTMTIRAWDVDALIERLKGIQEPPGLAAELQDGLPPIRRVAEVSPVATAPDPTPPTVAVAPATSPPPVVCEAPTSGPVETESDSDSPTDAAPASSTPRHLTIDPQPVTVAEDAEQRPLSRRARKELQKRLRQAAHREAGEKKGP